MKRKIVYLVLSIVLVAMTAPVIAKASEPPELSVSYAPCVVTEDTLEELIDCIYNQTPGRESEGFVIPTSEQREFFSYKFESMVSGLEFGDPYCPPISAPQDPMYGIMIRQEFVDQDNGLTYCVLTNVQDADNDGIVDHGWGTFIVNQSALRKGLTIAVPHIKADLDTHSQGIKIFKEVDAGIFLMAGAHRKANEAYSSCVPSSNGTLIYRVSDVAHNFRNMVYVATKVIDGLMGGLRFHLEFHGKATSSCAPADIVFGRGYNNSYPSWIIQNLHDNMQAEHPTWNMALPAPDYACLQATGNVLGRVLNVLLPYETVCDVPFQGMGGNVFIHIEQSRYGVHIDGVPIDESRYGVLPYFVKFRDPDNWVNAIQETFPTSFWD